MPPSFQVWIKDALRWFSEPAEESHIFAFPLFLHVFSLLTSLGFCFFCLDLTCPQLLAQQPNARLSIIGEQFHINGVPTYQGRIWRTSSGEFSIEGLLMNARLVQGIFDDLNPVTRGQWAYPDTGEWDPDRNTDEFIQAMDVWREHGLLAFTLNLQGGCPYGYCRTQPWDNSAFAADGSLRPAYMDRLDRIIRRADELGMIVILGYFYFGQDERLRDEAAVIKAVENATKWVLDKGYGNVVVEINNECNVRYDHAILRCDRVHELISRAKKLRSEDGRSLYVSTSLGGGSIPPANIIQASDYVLLHGNGVQDPQRMVRMIREVRSMHAYKPMPIVVNEDDQPWRVVGQGWGQDGNNFVEAVKQYASWGYFDFRRDEEDDDFNVGYQSVPVCWQLCSKRKRQFFNLLAEITGRPGAPEVFLDWSDGAGKVIAKIEKTEGWRIMRVELLLNNEIVTSAETPPFEFQLVEYPQKDHFIRVRATCQKGEREIIVASPLVKNPWWPYGGPADSTEP